MFMEFDMSAYQRTDTQARSEAYRTGIQNGYITPNEARTDLNLNKKDGADRLFIQSNMMPLDKVDDVLLKKATSPVARSIKELAELAAGDSNGNGNGKH